MPIIEDGTIIFSALTYRYGSNTSIVFGVEEDGDVVEVWRAPPISRPFPGSDYYEQPTLALERIPYALIGDDLIFGYYNSAYSGGKYNGTDSRFARIDGHGETTDIVAEVTGQSFDPTEIGGLDLLETGESFLIPLRPSNFPGQVYEIDPATGSTTQRTAFDRPLSDGAYGEILDFGGTTFLTADVWGQLGAADVWRLAPGTTAPELVLSLGDIGAQYPPASEVADMIVHDGVLWIGVEQHNGHPSALYRLDSPSGTVAEVPLPDYASDGFFIDQIFGFKKVGEALYLHTFSGLHEIAADGTVSADLSGGIHSIRDVEVFKGALYIAGSFPGQSSTELIRIEDDGTAVLVHGPPDLPGFFSSVSDLVAYGDRLYFRDHAAVDNGFGQMEMTNKLLWSLDGDGSTVTLLSDPEDFYAVGDILPFSTSAPAADVGTDASEALLGTAGDDTILGLGGNDWITPGEGSDSVDGGDGVDMISFVDHGQRVAVSLAGGEATSGPDTNMLANVENITGSIYGDLIEGDAGDNYLRGMGGYDWFVGSEGSDSYEGSNGRDMISYVFATERVGIDLEQQKGLFGQAGGDVYDSIERATGSSWADLFYGSGGEDEMRGMGGYDWFMSSDGGRDRYDGGSGRDTVSYAFAGEGVTASLSLGYGSRGEAAQDLYTSIENLTGTNFDDILTGDNERNILRGQYGRDILYGNGGTDYLTGGGSDDVLYGGDGWDVAVFEGDKADYTVFTAGDLTSVTYTPGGGDGMDLVLEIEALSFADGMIYL